MKRQMERSSIRSEATLLTTDNMDFLLSAMSSVELHGKVGRSFYRGRPHGRLYVGPTDEWASVCGTDGRRRPPPHHLTTLPQHGTGTGTSLYCTAQHRACLRFAGGIVSSSSSDPSPLLSSPSLLLPLPLPSLLLAPSRGFPSLSLPLLFSLFAEAPLRRASQVSTSTSTYVCMYLPTYDLASEAAVRFPFLSSRPLSLNKSSSLLDGMEMSEH